jgi:serine phosphatase RsbU (regulator of sigma subunit)
MIHTAASIRPQLAGFTAPAALLTLETEPSAPPFHWPLTAMRQEFFRKGQFLFKLGDKAERMFYLHRGAVRLPEIQKTVHAGEVIGELGMFSPRSERTASAICEEDLEAYSIGRQEVLEFFKRDPSLAIDLIQLTFKRLLENQRVEVEARERLESELRIARQIQMSMLPHSLPSAAVQGRIAIAATIEPAKEVGGDFYDYFMTKGDKLCLLIGDASGKGVPAALFVAVGKSLLRAEAGLGSRPHEIVARVNRRLCQDNPLCMFITLFCLTLDTRTGEAECCSAGHEPALLGTLKAGVETLDLPVGKAIGVMERARYQSRKIRLRAGETLFAYTDGVTDAIDAAKECFSRRRLIRCLQNSAGADLVSVLESVKKDLEAHRQFEPQSDDIAIAALRFVGAAGKRPRTRRG